MVVIIHHGNTADMILCHHSQGIGHRTSSANGYGIIDHTVLGTFHDSHLTGLRLNRHVLMNHTDSTLTGNGNSHTALGHRIHRGRYKRHVQCDVPRELGFQLYRLGQYFRISGNQEDVIECQTVHHNFICNK